MPAVQETIELLMCPMCNTGLDEEAQESVDEYGVCNNCIDVYTNVCESCDNHIFGESIDYRTIHRLTQHFTGEIYYYIRAQDSDDLLCEHCVYSCSTCDASYVNEENMWDCCPEPEEDNYYLHNYSYTPYLKYRCINKHGELHTSHHHTPGLLYMGMELEAEKLYDMDVWTDFLDKQDDSHHDPSYIYGKQDGSLDENSVEIVTMPSTLEAHRIMLKEEALQHLIDSGVRAWHRSRCGMHIHVARSAFTATHMYKFVFWQARMRDYCAEFAGRRSERWAAWNNEAIEDARNETAKFIKDRSAPRYTAINNLPHNTVELRYFRPNLTKHGIMRVLEFVDAIYTYTKQMTIKDVFDLKMLSVFENHREWNKFVQYLKDKPEYATAYGYIMQQWNIPQESE